MANKVSYVIQRENREYARVSEMFGASGFNSVDSVRSATKFNTVSDALAAIERRAQFYGPHTGPGSAPSYYKLRLLNIVRVEETVSAPRRELVTSGDLSLLDKGPVVLYGTGVCAYLQDGPELWGWRLPDRGLATARTFKNMATATQFLAESAGNRKACGPVSIRPIREIPGETIVTETVLA